MDGPTISVPRGLWTVAALGLDGVMSDSVELVLAYAEAAQRARASGLAEDFDNIRGFLADEVEIRLAGSWTDEPWRTAHDGPRLSSCSTTLPKDLATMEISRAVRWRRKCSSTAAR